MYNNIFNAKQKSQYLVILLNSKICILVQNYLKLMIERYIFLIKRNVSLHEESVSLDEFELSQKNFGAEYGYPTGIIIDSCESKYITKLFTIRIWTCNYYYAFLFIFHNTVRNNFI